MREKEGATGPVAVVGGVNIDICGRPAAPLVARDSNPGAVTMSLGGVGRNIAHNMALLGLPVSLLTALGEDLNAGRIEESCRELGLDLSYSLWVPGRATSSYLFITDHRGEMELAVNDMGIYEALTPQYIAQRMDFLNKARAVVVDTNLPADTLAYLAQHCAAPIFADPVSTVKGEKLRPLLGRLHTLKPNRLEAAMLSGVDIVDEKSLHRAADRLLETGLDQVFISLGGDGVLAADQRERRHVPIVPGQMVNTTGCGDAFMAAIVWAWLRGLDLAGTAQAGLAASAIAMESAETINPAMSAGAVEARMGRPAYA